MSHSVRWTVEKISQRLGLIDELVYRKKVALENFRYWEISGSDPLPTSPRRTRSESGPDPLPASPKSDWGTSDLGEELKPNSYWGRPSTEFVLRSWFEAPREWGEKGPVALVLRLGDAQGFSHPEALAYIDGQAYATADRHHQEVRLAAGQCDGQRHTLELRGWTGLGDNWNTGRLTRLVMSTCFVAQIDQATRDFMISARTALETARILDVNDPARAGLLNALDAAFKLLELREPFGEGFYESVPAAQAALKQGIAQAGPPLKVTMAATGHAHIDVAWLWTLAQTRKKTARTFHTVLRLMEQFPGYIFTQSQPQLYEYISEDHPQAFEAIKQRVAEGRWEPIGGMWVEADCNLSGAESLARQFLLGRSYFREQFGAGAESPVLWLPDVFGYAWALPQLIKQAGLEYFFTIKLGWSQYNRMPYDSFWWQGLDGTRVLTHFGTAPENGSAYASTYNAPATPESALGAWKNFQQKEIQEQVFMAFGYGDGGGGPTREMLENLGEMAQFPGLPQAKLRKAGDFFRDLEQNSGAELPVWNGELYLEYHRGTYTTQSRNKRANRKSEFALHDAEFLACLAGQMDAGYRYPAESLRAAWKLVCLNQFHDIIPGSSIGEVYVDSQKQYGEIAALAQDARQAALKTIGARLGGDVLVANPSGFRRSEPVFLAGEPPVGLERDGLALVTQPVEGGVLVEAGELAPYSVTSLSLTGAGGWGSGNEMQVSERLLENERLRVEFSNEGDITRIFDKLAGREVLPEGAIANQMQAFEDRPKFWDAWDIDIFYDDKRWLAEPAESMRVVESGPLRATLEVRRRILNSSYTQRISLTRNSARLDVETVMDWRERHVLLKVAFPVEVLSPVATHEIQWGNVQRPTHRNTSWDWARFETCAHKWVDLSEGGYGVSLLNDCKYGHDVQGNVLRLSLLRAPTAPDPEADQGEQRFTYSLLPHLGGWEAGTAAQAYALNDALIVAWMNGEGSGEGASLVSCDAPNIIIETVKQAEDGDGLIVRFYESQRRRGEVVMRCGWPLARAEKVNLMEERLEVLAPEEELVRVFVKPYEIVSLRLEFERG